MFFLFYLALGASVFSAIEAPIEKAELQELFQKRQDFLRKYPCLDGKGATVSKASCVYRLSASICFSLKLLFFPLLTDWLRCNFGEVGKFFNLLPAHEKA